MSIKENQIDKYINMNIINLLESKFLLDIENLEILKYQFYDIKNEIYNISTNLIDEQSQQIQSSSQIQLLPTNDNVKRQSTLSNNNLIKDNRAKTPFKSENIPKNNNARDSKTPNKLDLSKLNTQSNNQISSNRRVNNNQISNKTIERKSKSKIKEKEKDIYQIPSPRFTKLNKTPIKTDNRNKSPFVTPNNEINKEKSNNLKKQSTQGKSICYNEEGSKQINVNGSINTSSFNLDSSISKNKIDAKNARIDAGIQRNKKIDEKPNKKSNNKSSIINKTSIITSNNNMKDSILNTSSNIINENMNISSNNINKSLIERTELRPKTPIKKKIKEYKISKIYNKSIPISNQIYEILSNSDFLPIQKQFKMIIYCRFTFENNSLWNNIIKNKVKQWETYLDNQVEMYNVHLKNPSYDSLLNGTFVPSKTAKNGLNLIRNEDEQKLYSNEQSDDVYDFFKLIYILLKEDYSQIPKNELIINMKNCVFVKYGVDNISK